MKFHFIYNKTNEKYLNLAKSIKQYLEENKSKVNVLNKQTNKENPIDINKEDVYVFFSDNESELKVFYEKRKMAKRFMIITENLKVEYIMFCTDIAKDICYSKKEVSNICSRIEAVYEKYMDK